MKTIHLVQPNDGTDGSKYTSTVSFSPDPQTGFYHWYERRLWGFGLSRKAFVCGQDYRGDNDWVTADPTKVTCLGCVSPRSPQK